MSRSHQNSAALKRKNTSCIRPGTTVEINLDLLGIGKRMKMRWLQTSAICPV